MAEELGAHAWYRPQLDREGAEEALVAAGVLGGFLVRESVRAGRVLSYLGSGKRVNHLQIGSSARSGKVFIVTGGNVDPEEQFPGVAALIAAGLSGGLSTQHGIIQLRTEAPAPAPAPALPARGDGLSTYAVIPGASASGERAEDKARMDYVYGAQRSPKRLALMQDYGQTSTTDSYGRLPDPHQVRQQQQEEDEKKRGPPPSSAMLEDYGQAPASNEYGTLVNAPLSAGPPGGVAQEQYEQIPGEAETYGTVTAQPTRQVATLRGLQELDHSTADAADDEEMYSPGRHPPRQDKAPGRGAPGLGLAGAKANTVGHWLGDDDEDEDEDEAANDRFARRPSMPANPLAKQSLPMVDNPLFAGGAGAGGAGSAGTWPASANGGVADKGKGSAATFGKAPDYPPSYAAAMGQQSMLTLSQPTATPRPIPVVPVQRTSCFEGWDPEACNEGCCCAIQTGCICVPESYKPCDGDIETGSAEDSPWSFTLGVCGGALPGLLIFVGIIAGAAAVVAVIVALFVLAAMAASNDNR